MERIGKIVIRYLILSGLLIISFLLVPSLFAGECVIKFGGDKITHTKKFYPAPGQAWGWKSVSSSEFIQSTKGPCHFQVFNKKNFQGRSVTIGANLNGKIRAGIDGITNRSNGGGETWKIRSIKVIGVKTNYCRIEVEENGRTMTYGEINAEVIPAVGFIQKTRGACHYTVFDRGNYSGKHVVLGGNLNKKIRAGIDGIKNKDDGGGDIWKIRSIKIKKINTACRLSIGGDGVRMHYFSDDLDIVPAMNQVSWFTGKGCHAKVWKGADYGKNNSDNQFVKLRQTKRTRSVFDPGYRIRSIKIWNDKTSAQIP